MTPRTFDPVALLASFKDAFAPLARAQQEGIKQVETLARHQFAVAGDCLDWSIAHARAAAGASSPAEFFGKQVELNGQFGEQLRMRGEELSKLTSDAQASFRQLIDGAGTETRKTA